MRAPSPNDSRPSIGRVLRLLLLLWLTGIAIRIPILDVPPVLPLIRESLHMSETEVGLLAGLPLVLFALTAVASPIRSGSQSRTRSGIAGCTIEMPRLISAVIA